MRIAQVIDRDDLDFVGALRFIQRAQDVAADTSVTVDTYFDGHLSQSPYVESQKRICSSSGEQLLDLRLEVGGSQTVMVDGFANSRDHPCHLLGTKCLGLPLELLDLRIQLRPRFRHGFPFFRTRSRLAAA